MWAANSLLSSYINISLFWGNEKVDNEKVKFNRKHYIPISPPQINGYLLCGKLKSAYLIAVKAGRADDVRRIAAAADRAGQNAVKAICDKWLQQKAPKPWEVLVLQILIVLISCISLSPLFWLLSLEMRRYNVDFIDTKFCGICENWLQQWKGPKPWESG